MKKEIQIAVTHICTEFGCTPMELNDKDRHKPLPDARKAVSYFLTRYTKMGVAEIAETMSRDHSSVSYQYGSAVNYPKLKQGASVLQASIPDANIFMAAL